MPVLVQEGLAAPGAGQSTPDLATFGLVKSEMKSVSRVSDDHTEEVPAEVQSALPRPPEINAPDTPSPRWDRVPGTDISFHQM